MRPALRFSRSFGSFRSLVLSALGVALLLAPGPAIAQAPVVTAPPTARSLPGCLLTFTVTASAVPGETITSLVATGAPIDLFGATFTTNATNTEGTFSWQIPVALAGTFTVTFRATDSAGLLGSASTSIAITQSDRPPIVNAPTSVAGPEGQQLCFTVSAVDPDGDVPTLQMPGVVPQGAQFIIGPPSQGTFCWTPTFTQAGVYTVTFCAASTSCTGAPLTGCTMVSITITQFDHPPILDPIGDLTVDAGAVLDHPLNASDADGDAIFFSKASGPFFVTVTTTSPGLGTATGNLHAAPSVADLGVYPVTVVASNTFSDSETLTLTVTQCVCPPVADPGGPYQAPAGVPVQFDGTGSSDPLGSPLSYLWDFGDGATASGPQPLHAYAIAGTYTVSLTVGNNRGQFDDGTTAANIGGPPTAFVFTTGGNGTVRLASSKPSNCVHIEPAGGAFSIENVDLASIVMRSTGTGSVAEIPAISGKTVPSSDANRNGVPEIEACFAKENLRLLFSTLPSGRSVVQVSVEGNLIGGGRFTSDLTLEVFSTGGALAASFSFDRGSGQGVLTFVTGRAGSARVLLFDARGRLVRTLLDASHVSAGAHDVRIASRGDGAPLAAGIYFYRVIAAEGTTEGRAIVLK